MTISEYIFETLLPNLLVKNWVKGLVMVVFSVYLGLSIYWVTQTR